MKLCSHLIGAMHRLERAEMKGEGRLHPFGGLLQLHGSQVTANPGPEPQRDFRRTP